MRKRNNINTSFHRRRCAIAFVLEDGHFLLNLCIFDEHNFPVLVICDNRLIYTTQPWDIQLIGRNLVIREARRRILVDIDFDVPSRIVINRGRFLLNGVELLSVPKASCS